ncbi:MAG: hypothetical protein HY659_08580 [Rhizobiales bacterium]|nr:hypothetical protein [Hyphomicrobiales bacterium]
MRHAFVSVCLAAAIPIPLVFAQSYKTVTAKELERNANKLLNQHVELRGAFCGRDQNETYECAIGDTLIIRAKSMTAGPDKDFIDKECGILDTTEQTSFCKFNLRFVPTDFTLEDDETEIKRGGKVVIVPIKVAVFTVDTVTPLKGR